MDTINFRYTENIDVTVNDNFSSRNIFIKQKDQTLLKIMFRGKYFYAIEFSYDIFGNRGCGLDYIRMTAKDGSAFLARLYVNGTFYAVRKKKKKPQIIFVKSNMISNFRLGKDVFDPACYYNGVVSNDEQLINDFFEKRQTIEYDEQKYIDSLNPEDKKDYLNDKKIEEIIEEIGKKNKIKEERIEDLIFYVQCMPDEDEVKSKILNAEDADELTPLVLPLLTKAKEHSGKVDATALNRDAFLNREYTFDNKFIYSNNNLDLLSLNLTDDEWYVQELLWFFEDEYEQIKDYLRKGIEKAKKTINEALPFFKKYVGEHK